MPSPGIIGMTDMALDTDLTAEQREQIGMVKISAESLLLIVNGDVATCSTVFSLIERETGRLLAALARTEESLACAS